MRVFEPDPNAAAKGAAALCIYLVVLAAVLVRRCLMAEPIDAVYNEPKNLLSLPRKTLALQLEGIIAKRLDSPSVPGIRSNDWLKIKRKGAIPRERFKR